MSAAKKDRITARVSSNVFETLSSAAELSGSTVNQFLVAAAMKEAERVIEKERVIRLTAENSREFLDALTNTPEPTDRLVQFFKEHA